MDYFLRKFNGMKDGWIDFVVYKKMLLESLNNLILALELYLSEYVEKIEINQYNPDIASLTPTHVLSFNYTDTYRRVYDDAKAIAERKINIGKNQVLKVRYKDLINSC